MLDTYIKMDDTEYIFGQDARTKEWYCKELRAKSSKEADRKMGEANKVCNKYNKQMKINQKKDSSSSSPSDKISKKPKM